MYCTFCEKDIKWIEIHLKSNHEEEFIDYLLKNYDLPENYKEKEKPYCYQCEKPVTWLQGHYRTQHKDVDFNIEMDIVYTLKEEISLLRKQKDKRKKKNLIIKQKRFDAKKGTEKQSKEETMIVDYQGGRIKFRELFDYWSSKIQHHSYRNAYVIPSLSVTASSEDMFQELTEAFYKAAETFDVERGYKFKTYLWTCIHKQVSAIRNKHKTKGRDFTLVSTEDLSKSFEDGNYDTISQIALKEQPDKFTAKKYRDIELKESLSKLNLTYKERVVLKSLLANLTKTEISRLIDSNIGEINKIIERLRVVLKNSSILKV